MFSGYQLDYAKVRESFISSIKGSPDMKMKIPLHKNYLGNYDPL
jgi:hypothetical protein